MAVIIPGQVASRNDSAAGTFVPDGALGLMADLLIQQRSKLFNAHLVL